MAPLYDACHNLRMETMYNTTCMAAKMALSSKVNEKQTDVCFQCFLFKLVASMGILFLVNLNYEILKINISKETSLCRWQVSNCRSVSSVGGKDLKTCKQLWDFSLPSLRSISPLKMWTFAFTFNSSLLLGGANVGGLPVSCQRCSSQVFQPISFDSKSFGWTGNFQDPDSDAHNHLQKSVRHSWHSVEVRQVCRWRFLQISFW